MTFALLSLLACGPDCQTTCEHIHGDAAGQCDIQPPNTSPENAIANCANECDAAMREAGAVGAYDPNEQVSSNENIALENERQAALWMECVMGSEGDGSDATACEDLERGICAPIHH
jgi:hypothetical protein